MIEFTNGFSPEAEKERIRHVHLIDRDDQLRQPATRAFIKGMEKKRLTKKGWHSIYSVMRDGESLARDLSAIRGRLTWNRSSNNFAAQSSRTFSSSSGTHIASTPDYA